MSLNKIPNFANGVIDFGFGLARLAGIADGINANDAATVGQLNTGGVYSLEAGIIASSLGNQAGATQLTEELNIVGTVGGNGYSVKLPVAVSGMSITIKNAAFPNSLAVFPNTGGNINGGSTNASVSLSADSEITFIASSATRWEMPTNLNTDTISESYSGSGVTIDSVLLKDGSVVLPKGTVTQLTAITTGVEVNASAGVITTVSSTLAAGSNATFIVTNSHVTATSVILLTPDDSATAGLAKLNVQTVGAGVFSINITNVHSANAFNNVVKIHFLVV